LKNDWYPFVVGMKRLNMMWGHTINDAGT